ncbi:hypothetical protein Pmar_PMAR012987 [Perkinsus marinus ATCC 50983]|uniref:Uncharacterized protein n=1 Tax=Perkinsus marinus (strain ATCC 50983 / TXsc) TaxID=423536 RepID=C5KZD1_PERM5|nr:hypothetical protein Pmar_PMAR012987 [Perkinsus marinus ATCC 50983]EER10162.1 hypothetical protein Pmar_PMAR012987 [Perkinsus marinus ATCC 50983]|eukprot:XP_002778367.1 hypothetical protein Pmar_PMAR012987 [Perkinsus marinus ATCC 50983]
MGMRHSTNNAAEGLHGALKCFMGPRRSHERFFIHQLRKHNERMYIKLRMEDVLRTTGMPEKTIFTCIVFEETVMVRSW